MGFNYSESAPLARTLYSGLRSRSIKNPMRLPLWLSAISALVCFAIAAGSTWANTIYPLSAEIISQGTYSSTGDVYSQGMMVQSGPWQGEIYSQGMEMSTGDIYSQGSEITITSEMPDDQPLSEGTNNASDAPATNASNNQSPTNFPSASDTSDEGRDPIVGAGNSTSSTPAISTLITSFLTGSDDPPFGSPSSGLSTPAFSDLADVFTTNNSPPAGAANSGQTGPDDPPSTSASTNLSADPLPEPNSFTVFGSALLLFGFELCRRTRSLNRARSTPAFCGRLNT